MSIPLHMFSVLDRQYNHYKYIKSEIRDAKGMLEQVRRGIYNNSPPGTMQTAANWTVSPARFHTWRGKLIP